ncbi:HAMP domain-containing sensor histidine kinase [Chitinibacter tainanensis]|uniref:sensor histidine kinase n=1 Tax=Chitinibacter tainanensis TaxID=230667 RepID=UPI0023541073|nr:HAMP domain-containing sensor histidine kinase [Chitinibacter tainanensis]
MLLTKRSLQRRIVLWTVLPLLALWLAAAAVIYFVSFHYLTDNNDATLARFQIELTKTLQQDVQQGNELTAGLIRQRTTQLLALSQPEHFHFAALIDHQQAINTPLQAFDSHPSAQAQQRLFDHSVQHHAYRVLHANIPPSGQHPGWQIEIAKSLDSQIDALHAFMLRIALPLIAILLLISILIWYGIKNSLKPLLTLKQMVETRQPQDLSPLVLPNAPEELEALSSALNQLLTSTEESMNRQRRFIADAAHQLRTPLAGLKSQTELAMRENSPEGLRERLNMVHTSATRSIHLVNQLLTLARSEPGSLNGIPKVKMDLARIIRDLTSELVPRALAARIDLGCDCLVNEAWIEGNSALLRELFINLVENAIKYIPRDGSVTVRLTETPTQYVVDVEDNGPGIPDADKQRVFERFFRREQTGNGCGLGMAIVKEIVERHDGTVELLDADPSGLIVQVVLPKNLINS